MRRVEDGPDRPEQPPWLDSVSDEHLRAWAEQLEGGTTQLSKMLDRDLTEFELAKIWNRAVDHPTLNADHVLVFYAETYPEGRDDHDLMAETMYDADQEQKAEDAEPAHDWITEDGDPIEPHELESHATFLGNGVNNLAKKLDRPLTSVELGHLEDAAVDHPGLTAEEVEAEYGKQFGDRFNLVENPDAADELVSEIGKDYEAEHADDDEAA